MPSLAAFIADVRLATSANVHTRMVMLEKWVKYSVEASQPQNFLRAYMNDANLAGDQQTSWPSRSR